MRPFNIVEGMGFQRMMRIIEINTNEALEEKLDNTIKK